MQITIQGHNFEVPEGVLAMYEPGATITLDEGTASTLRQVKCENLRNNFAKQVKDAANGGELSEQAHGELQTKFNEYAESYQFGIRRVGSGGGRRTLDPLEKEINQLMRGDIIAAFKAAYGKQKIDKEAIEEAIDQLKNNEGTLAEYTKRARQNLRDRERRAEGILQATGLMPQKASA